MGNTPSSTGEPNDLSAPLPQEIFQTLLSSMLSEHPERPNHHDRTRDSQRARHATCIGADPSFPYIASADLRRTIIEDWQDYKQPLDSLANFQYYGVPQLPPDIDNVFTNATLYDIMMISRAFATKILHLFALECSNPAFGGNIATSQKFVRGNVAVLPQDSVNLQFVLPPTRSVIADAMCALFVRWKTKPTRENIASLRPVLVSKRRARTLIDFLVNHNVWYKIAGLTFLEENLSDLYPEDENDVDESVPTAVEICHLDGSHGLAAATSDYADRRTFHAADPQPELHEMVMDIVGYASGDYTPQNHKMMKAEALARVLDGSQFLKMQAGSNFINERDPGLMSYLFPHLDP
ncbi:hypothetical protein SERLA73DRAFT_163520 [Serpula lacrymans var. lacrymans S7.3]|uniref:DUF6570 domain-containing protein n=1 Tax=Serpula lacrymans var. lacrymans (strain S7.3) TaxID=936435 RepID=F8QE98_SERL3|nr:hypothetical protein SERLA73DRAFT_163520 [Serpula lacrymans var. lacrymans S7.3]